MEKFLVLYLAPVSVIEEWMKTDPEVRKTEEQKMQSEWHVWMEKFGTHIKETAGAGKTKRVNSEGSTDTKNDVMLYSIVEGESHDAVAKMFEGHPHLSIPQATIEIMKVNMLSGMG